MRLLTTLFRKLFRWWKSPFASPYRTRYIEELPKEPDQKTIYIVRDEGFIEHATLLCPCGCGALLHMNLIPDDRPCWFVTEHGNETVSLKPSIWRKTGCRSHFIFERGHIRWCS